MQDDYEEPVQEPGTPISETSLRTNSEQIEGLVNDLIRNLGETGQVRSNPGEKPVLGAAQLKLFAAWLAEARVYFQKASNQDVSQPVAAEWVLDNYYIIQQAVLQISEDLPVGFYRQLPKLAGGPLKAMPRMFGIARTVLSSQNYLLNTIDLQAILIEVQEQIPLTMGELWSLPIFLRYSLIETLAHVLEKIIHPQLAPRMPAMPAQLSGAVEPFLAAEGAEGVSLASAIVANVILSLRTISEQNWNDFFESVSSLDQILRKDPAGIYARMDFKTRDLYRKEIETLSLANQGGENELADIVLDLARKNNVHVGEFLLGNGRAEFEKRIGYHPNTKTALKRWAAKHASIEYLVAIVALALLILAVILAAANLPGVFLSGLESGWSAAARSGAGWAAACFLAIALLAPCLTVSSSLVNWLVTLSIKPRILPKLHFKEAILPPFQTLVVIPALIHSHEEIDDLAHQLEMHFLRNPEPGMLFALLTDFRDADSQTLPEDEEMVVYAEAVIAALNLKYCRSASSSIGDESAGDDQLVTPKILTPGAAFLRPIEADEQLFYLLHRKRLWNPSEGKWMGWERKRGKLHELNRLLRGDKDLTFLTIKSGTRESARLECIRFVITLDADTILPRGAARRLAGTLAHPLNNARFNPMTGQVLSGYTILQPRMEIHPRSANLSWFTRIFAGDTGLDLYTRSVSDAYQDLFGEGSYVGKGIYDVDGFERSVNNRIPENSVLSHDLLEGNLGRAGLVTDITLIEDYPPNYIVQIKRQQRWIRGDWQLLPWVLQPGQYKVTFSAVGRWKMLDNLFRALLTPSLFAIFTLGILFAPGLGPAWLMILLFSLGIPLLTSTTWSLIQTLKGEKPGAAFHPLVGNLARWALAVTFLPYEAYNALDAIQTTLYRLMVSHRDLLQWTTAAQSARLFGLQGHRNNTWLRMTASSLLALGLGGAIQWMYAQAGAGIAPVLILSAPLLLAWMFSPLISAWINRPIKHRAIPLSVEQAGLFRQVARRTWGFFERFVGPEDHWLPPDHFQEEPVGIIAHQTSPSNIGLLFTSTLAAYDLGYLDQLGLATRLTTTMGTLDQLERFRGHFLNWYDTLTLQPLHPRYVSTVDSGNLAASLIVTAQACKHMPEERIFRWELWQGYLDTLSNLSETLSGMRKAEFAAQVEAIEFSISAMRTQILQAKNDTPHWYALFQKASGPFWQELSSRLVELVKVGSSAFNLEALRKLQEVAAQVERHHLAIQRTIVELVPWILILEKAAQFPDEPRFVDGLKTLRGHLPYNPVLKHVQTHGMAGLSASSDLRLLLREVQPVLAQGSDSGNQAAVSAAIASSASGWLDALDAAITQVLSNADELIQRFAQITARAEQFVAEMDFKFLYHPQRRVFHIGFNLDAGQLDHNYYDLLASEARIASIVALAKGEVPQAHWLQLGRPLTRVEGVYVLLSWSATMFEYLMPPLFLRSYPGTLLADSAQGAVIAQIAYGKARGVPWGISEAGYYRFDPNQNYQYRAFGVPGLGFKRGLEDDLVIAPYASLMAIGSNPHAVAQNLASLLEHNSFGLYGFYEAIDFTLERLPEGETWKVVQEYMVHHQGMILMALVNYFHQDIMVKRMHSDPRIQSVDLLLQEQIPQSAPIQNPYAGDVKGIRRLTAAPVEIDPWSVAVQSAIPQVHLLSNGDYGVLISNMGSGYSTWRGLDLTRWQADGVLDPWGSWVYIQELEPGQDGDSLAKSLWSAGYQPIPGDPEKMQVTFFAHMAVFRRTENGITSTMEITVYPDDPVEIRRIHLHNTNNQPSHLRLTSYGEVILTPQIADSRHPAFNKLFIESEFVPELNLQIFTRRPRSAEEAPIFLGHMLVVESKGKYLDSQPQAWHEADRNRFIGRGQSLRSPAALVSEGYLSGTSGATLDPIYALGQDLELGAQEIIEVAFLTFAGDSREAVMTLARRYHSWALIDRSFHQANIATQTWLGTQAYDSQAFKNTLQILSALLYPYKTVRAAPETIAANRMGQPGLWRFGVSGDNPIILVEIEDPKQVDLIREVLQVHKYLASRRFLADVVILNRQQSDYGAELNAMLYKLVSRSHYEQWVNQRGGVYILYADQLNPEETILLQTAGRFLLSDRCGSMAEQMPIAQIQVYHLPEFIPTRSGDISNLPSEVEPLPATPALQFFNGFGGFSQDGREYVIDLPRGLTTPAPWVNVIAYPNFGFMVSESGSQCTWAVNSGENRLTPWSNDPVRDPTGEALYLRDEETGDVWTPTPLPAGAGQAYRVTHGAGYSVFENNSFGLRQRLTLFASPEDPIKVIFLRVENSANHPRRITATQYTEWVLGSSHAASMAFLIPEYDAAEACLLATNPYSAEFGERTAFLIASKTVHGLTADRTEFLGRGGSPAFPAALRRLGLETRLTPGEDPCAVLQLHLDLLPGGVEEIYFVLGQGSNKADALRLARKYHDPAYVGAALERTNSFWEHLLGAIQVHTPEPASDLILNRWLLYQSLSCRIWGRSGFYQPSGAFGFRDQLQDVLALLAIDPAIPRGQILNAAQRQFAEGDVLHWWHLPSGRGVRTRISDDLLWLAYVTAQYVEASGDASILDEKITFLQAAPLNRGEQERYQEFPRSQEAVSLWEHCRRAIEKGCTYGAHGLPLIGTGDWNDGLNRVGEAGKGESVWLAWFLCDVLERFASLCEQRGDGETAKRYRASSTAYAAAVEQTAWDGAWYRRAYYDDGAPLGSGEQAECQIDAIAQSWAVLSGAGDPARSRLAMQAVLDRLVLPQERLSLLFNPPFDKTVQNPGYIKGYFPGTRENGGQYTHAATWTAWAFASLGDGQQAGELFDLLNPILRSDTFEKAGQYRVEPYVICADIYSQPPHLGRGGWTWYTGSAAWMHRLGLTAILGFKKVGNLLYIDPTIPPGWDGFEIAYRFGSTHYQIAVQNPQHVSHCVLSIQSNGKLLDPCAIPLVDDGQEHRIEVILGEPGRE